MAKLVSIKLEDDRGGLRTFDELPQAILWCQKQREAWKNEFVGPNLPDAHPIAIPSYAREQVLESFQRAYDAQAEGPFEREGVPELIASNSPVFLALKWTKERSTLEGLSAAAVAAGLGTGRIDWTSPTQSIPVLMFERSLRTCLDGQEASYAEQLEQRRNANSKHIDDAAAEIANITGRIDGIISVIESIEARGQSSFSKVNADIALAELGANEKLTAIATEISKLSTSAADKLESVTAYAHSHIGNWMNGFKEANQLQAPVVLWNERASSHETQLTKRLWWMVGVGIVGLVLCVIASVLAFIYSGALFNDVVADVIPATSANTPANAAVTVDGLKGIFKYQLLAASAATLLFLTMYLWTMKLLVRLYTTEHHLAIDAKGRSALTETYLSLTKEGKATDADRAIMLAVLFRPVADGMVKEESPPAISPAAIIAGLASNPTK